VEMEGTGGWLGMGPLFFGEGWVGKVSGKGARTNVLFDRMVYGGGQGVFFRMLEVGSSPWFECVEGCGGFLGESPRGSF